ncbi:MAG: hypothetical protein ABR956_17370 [Terracidiphilus sp.]|jgi:hypothetical protein
MQSDPLVGDSVLEDVNPFNTWRCEACGKQWSEAAAGAEGKPLNAEK